MAEASGSFPSLSDNAISRLPLPEMVVLMPVTSGARDRVIHANVAEIIITVDTTSSSATAASRSFSPGRAALYARILFAVSFTALYLH